MKTLTEKQLRLKKARTWLNKNFNQGWGVKWTDQDLEVKSLARIIKL